MLNVDWDLADLELPPGPLQGPNLPGPVQGPFWPGPVQGPSQPSPGVTTGSSGWLNGLNLDSLLPPPSNLPGVTTAPSGWDVTSLLKPSSETFYPDAILRGQGVTQEPELVPAQLDGSSGKISQLSQLSKAIGSMIGARDETTQAMPVGMFSRPEPGLDTGTIAIVLGAGLVAYLVFNK